MDYLINIDTQLFFFVNQNLGLDFLDPFFSLISSPTFWGVVLLIAVALGLWKSRKLFFFLSPRILAVVSLTDWIAFRYLKPYFGRIRPCYQFDLLVRLVESRCGGELSFPSNHAANGFAFLAVLVWSIPYFPKLKIAFKPALLAVSLVAFSRIYLGVHFPGDVTFGALFGFSFSYLVLGLCQKMLDQLAKGFRQD